MCNCVCTSTHHDIRHKVLSLQGFWELWSLFQFTSLPLDTRATAGIWTDWNGLEPTGDTSNLSGSANVRINISTATAATLVLSRGYPHQRTPRLPLAGFAWFDPLGLPCPSQKRPVLVESPVPGWQTPDSESRLNQGATKCIKMLQGHTRATFPHLRSHATGKHRGILTTFRLSGSVYEFVKRTSGAQRCHSAARGAVIATSKQLRLRRKGAMWCTSRGDHLLVLCRCVSVSALDGWMDGCTDDHDLVEQNQKESSGELCSDNTLRVNSTSEKTVWREDYKCLPLLK